MTAQGGGRTLYGHALGVLMLDTGFPRVPGDVGNALTWPFPVLYRIVEGAVSSRVMGRSPDRRLLGEFIEAGLDLQTQGVQAITTSCGFLAIHQRELSAALSVPVLTSSLLQIPMVSRLIGRRRSVGVITERANLTDGHLRAVGCVPERMRLHVGAFRPGALFPTVFIDGQGNFDYEVLKHELVEAAEDLTQNHPDVGAIVLESTNFVPFSLAVRHATGLPVFDLFTLVMQAYEATSGRDFGRP